MTKVFFPLYSAAGSPLFGATPVVAEYRRGNGDVLTPPAVLELGGGFYAFDASTEDVVAGTAYIVDGGTSVPQYTSGSVGNLVAFALYDDAGEPLPGETVAFAAYLNKAGASMAAPAVGEIGGGLYGFSPPVMDITDGRLYVLTTSASPSYFAGELSSESVEGEPPNVTNFTPAPGTEYAADEVFSFDVVDPEGALRYVEVLAMLPGVYEVVHDGVDFGPNYRSETNTRAPIANGWHFTVRRKGGWSLGGLQLCVRAVDTSGLENN